MSLIPAGEKNCLEAKPKVNFNSHSRLFRTDKKFRRFLLLNFHSHSHFACFCSFRFFYLVARKKNFFSLIGRAERILVLSFFLLLFATRDRTKTRNKLYGNFCSFRDAPRVLFTADFFQGGFDKTTSFCFFYSFQREKEFRLFSLFFLLNKRTKNTKKISLSVSYFFAELRWAQNFLSLFFLFLFVFFSSPKIVSAKVANLRPNTTAKSKNLLNLCPMMAEMINFEISFCFCLFFSFNNKNFLIGRDRFSCIHSSAIVFWLSEAHNSNTE